MCFSANASFITGSVLVAVGIVSLQQTKAPKQLPFAGIPLIFGIQQLCEGALWLSLNTPEHYQFLNNFAKYAFMFFAQVVWPFWVPFSVLLFEPNSKNKNVLKFILILGSLIGAYLGYCIASIPLEASAQHYHILYQLDYPHKGLVFVTILYFIPTVFPPFLSSLNSVKLIGAINLASFVVSKYFFGNHLVSVWCFFAAIISITVLLVVRKANSNA